MSDKRKDYISWDEYFMGVAKLPPCVRKIRIHRWVRVLSAKIIKSSPWDITDCQGAAPMMNFRGQGEGDPLDNKYLYTAHSELNAILNYQGGTLQNAKCM